jgi:hypothetical protein
MAWPLWWHWQLEITGHVERRMQSRNFTEIDLRHMLQHAIRYRSDVSPGRWIVETRLRDQQWEVIVEPDPERRQLIVITAYPTMDR